MDSPIDINAQIACVQRELVMRERVYTRRVAAGQMTPEKATHEIVAMRKVAFEQPLLT